MSGFCSLWLYQSKAFKNFVIKGDYVFWDKPHVNAEYPELRFASHEELLVDDVKVTHCVAKLSTFTKWLLRMNDYCYD